jgi:hypothetical protein
MTPSGPASRGLALATILLTSMLTAVPSRAAQAELDLLHSYLGSWKGTGILTGAASETVRCRLELTPGNQDKVNYSGRCAIAGSPLSVKGTLAYIDSSRRFEAAMTSNAGFSPDVAVGLRQGSGIRFNLSERATGEEGEDVTITAVIALEGGGIQVELDVLYNESGDRISASVPFTR